MDRGLSHFAICFAVVALFTVSTIAQGIQLITPEFASMLPAALTTECRTALTSSTSGCSNDLLTKSGTLCSDACSGNIENFKKQLVANCGTDVNMAQLKDTSITPQAFGNYISRIREYTCARGSDACSSFLETSMLNISNPKALCESCPSLLADIAAKYPPPGAEQTVKTMSSEFKATCDKLKQSTKSNSGTRLAPALGIFATLVIWALAFSA